MKKYIIIGSIIIILLVGGFFTWHYLRVKNAKIEIVLKDDLDIEFLSDAKVSDFIESINGEIIDDKKIDTTKVGTQEVVFKFINEDNIELESSYKINVVDVTPVGTYVHIRLSHSRPILKVFGIRKSTGINVWTAGYVTGYVRNCIFQI